MSNGMSTAKKLSHSESKTNSTTELRSLQMCVSSSSPVQLEHIEDLSMWLAQVSHANPLLSQGNSLARRMNETDGQRHLMLFAQYDHQSRGWRTTQGCLLTNTMDEYKETWPKSAINYDGAAYQVPSWERPISGSVFGWSLIPSKERLPTLVAHEARLGWQGRHSQAKGSQKSLTTVVMEQAGRIVGKDWTGGQLNPDWTDWFMGLPIGLTDLKPLEISKCLSWLRQHSDYSQNNESA